MANFYSTSDLLKGALQRAGEVADGTSDFHSVCLKYLNQIYFNILSGSNEFNIDMGEAFPWALASSPKILILEKKVTGSVSLTNGSKTAGLGAGKDDWVLILDDHSDKYRLDASGDLDGNFTGDTASYNYTLVKIRYDLGSDIIRLVEPFRMYRDSRLSSDMNGKIYGVDALSFRREFPLKNIEAGPPTRFYTGYDVNQSMYAEFNAYASDEEMRIELDYIPMPTELVDSDDSVPLIPRQYRSVLEYGAAYFVALDKEDQIANSLLQLCQAKMLAMIEGTRKQYTHTGRDKGRLIPRSDLMSQRTINKTYL